MLGEMKKQMPEVERICSTVETFNSTIYSYLHVLTSGSKSKSPGKMGCVDPQMPNERILFEISTLRRRCSDTHHRRHQSHLNHYNQQIKEKEMQSGQTKMDLSSP